MDLYRREAWSYPQSRAACESAWSSGVGVDRNMLVSAGEYV